MEARGRKGSYLVASGSQPFHSDGAPIQGEDSRNPYGCLLLYNSRFNMHIVGFQERNPKRGVRHQR